MEQHLIVFYEKKVLIIIEVKSLMPLNQILDWYSENYAIEREKLSACWSHIIKCTSEY